MLQTIVEMLMVLMCWRSGRFLNL